MIPHNSLELERHPDSHITSCDVTGERVNTDT